MFNRVRENFISFFSIVCVDIILLKWLLTKLI